MLLSVIRAINIDNNNVKNEAFQTSKQCSILKVRPYNAGLRVRKAIIDWACQDLAVKVCWGSTSAASVRNWYHVSHNENRG